jgi:hypothetical protein
MVLTGVFASQAIDKSGEVLDVESADISSLKEGKGFVNFEHKLPEKYAQEESPTPDSAEEVVGKVIFAKKIMSEDDASDEDQRKFWKRFKLPIIYGAIRLFDAAGHKHAQAIAAMVRDAVANNEPLEVGFSVEGAVLNRKGMELKESVVRGVALTVKPCNATAGSELMYDPLAPEGFVVMPKGRIMHKNEDPTKVHLSGTIAIYGPELMKALSAGSYDASPGSLTGGAALQREHVATAKAARRDWPKGQVKFRPFLKKYFEKSNISDVSDEFLDHYSDLVESEYWRVKKSEEVIEDLKKAGKWKYNKDTQMLHLEAKPEIQLDPKKKGARFPKDADSLGAVPQPVGPLTNNGKPVKPNPKLKDPVFDDKTGTLHMPEGSFKVYIPSRDTPEIAKAFDGLMNDPKIEKFHGYAMQNWSKAHKLLKAGRLPPEVAMHAVLFSNLSPNTPVPNQELMYGHLVDSMKATGQTPLTEGWSGVRQDWLNRDQPQKFPDHSPQHWKRLEDSLRIGGDSKGTNRQAGDIGSFMLADSKFDNMTRYSKLHGGLMDLLARHKGNSQAAAEEMMFHHYEKRKHDNRRRLGLEAGRPDIGEYPGLPVAGLAPKTARYALAMMGGGNVHVPDTHFVRNLFGLNREQDGATIDRIKKYLWNSKNTPLLNGIDRYYAQNHDAVRHMLNHPKWGSVFEKPEDAIFPAFWKHWMAIVPHEKARGHSINGYNELTDHRPFWEAVAPHMKKSELGDVARHTATQHAQWQLQYGEQPAMMLYYVHLLPKLLEAGATREAGNVVRKAQALQVDALAKGFTPGTQAKFDTLQDEEAKPITYQNRQVVPGHGVDEKSGNGYHLLGVTASEFHAIPDNKSPHDYQPEDLVRIPKTSPLNVVKFPESVDHPAVVDADKHGIGLYTPQARELAHGFNFENRSSKQATGGFTLHSGDAYWAKGPKGQHVYVKSTVHSPHRSGEHPWNEARREGAYYDIAHNVFGLGHLLPTVANVIHPKTGREYALVEHVEGQDGDDISTNTMNKVPTDTVHQAAIMNTIMGNNDRHGGNFRVDDKGNMKLIDHNLWGDATNWDWPYYMTSKSTNQPLSPAVQKWVAGLDKEALGVYLMKHHAPPAKVDAAVRRLESLQTRLRGGQAHQSIGELAHGLNTGVQRLPPSDTSSDSESY